MPTPPANDSLPRTALWKDTLILALVGCVVLAAHFAMGNGYGFHRDELQFLDDARHLDWGFVAYPPATAFAGRVAIALFGISPEVFRLPAAVVNAVSMVLVGLVARELGGRRPAQVVAALAVLPVALTFSSVLQYNTFDYLAWALTALFTAKLLRSGDARWWVPIGASVGLGVLSKYSIAFLAVSLVAGVAVLPSQRRFLRSRWFYLGVLAMLLVASPNLVWLARHQFMTLQMEQFIHARDVRQGRADGYYTDQLKFTLLAFPLALAGMVWLGRSRRFRLLAAMYVGPFVLLALVRGRGYYLLPGYIVLYAAGAVVLERSIAMRSRAIRIFATASVAIALAADAAVISWAYLPVAPVGSAMWKWQMKNNYDMANEIGWTDFVDDVAGVRDELPPQQRKQLMVLANNYGEAGAIALYGPSHGLPAPVSSTNSFYDRGYGPFVPHTVIATGFDAEEISRYFSDCVLAGYVEIPYGVRNEESADHPDIFVCHHLRGSWPALWVHVRSFG